ncbi:MAG: hypothetical protein V3U90_06050 [Dehalococcoidia bacterium]
MALKLTVPAVGVLGGLAAFVVYLLVDNFAAASWAAIATIWPAILMWDVWKNHGGE